ncbi:integrase family protein [Rhizobium phaseoli]|nr:tyrosine-type recombinase/integrase [Rhizobium phaseoli]ANL71951.1 integrase family protein [Rhizobium phaseoli]
MAKYQRRTFQLGEWYLAQRENSPAWYRTRYNTKTKRTERVSLGTDDFDAAKKALTTWYYDNLRLQADSLAPEKVALSVILLDYWNNHARNIASAKSREILIRYWNDFWKDATVADTRSPVRQEEFQQWLSAKGLNVGSVNRTLEVGSAAINRAWKRGIISNAPFIQKVRDDRDLNDVKKGADITLEHLRAFYRGSEVEHWHDLLVILMGTACRPGAARELTKEQIDFENGLVYLNRKGRKQTDKHRPTVKLPPTMAARFRDRPEGVLVLWRGQATEKNERLMRIARRRAGLGEDVNLYSIRHFCARWMRQSGVDPWSCAAQLGHGAGGRLTITERYATADPLYLQAPCRALENLLQAVLAPKASQSTPEAPAAYG